MEGRTGSWCVCAYVERSTRGKYSFWSVYVHLHCVWNTRSHLPSWCFPGVRHGSPPHQPHKWPVRALGNVDVQIMTCWKARTPSLSPAGNWFLDQFIVSICAAHHRCSYFSNTKRERDRDKYERPPGSNRLQLYTGQMAHAWPHSLMIIWHDRLDKVGWINDKLSFSTFTKWRKTHGAHYLLYLISPVKLQLCGCPAR